MYLIEALRHDVPAFHEDRLTQIVCATFNTSNYFKRIFLEFLKTNYKIDNLVARTQVSNIDSASRPDLIIFDKEVPIVLIECKVDARAEFSQQKRHFRLKCKHNFLLARDPVLSQNLYPGFRKLSWYSFFSFLLKKSSCLSESTDKFLINELISYGRECEMLLPDSILKSDLDTAAALLTQIRLRRHPSLGFKGANPFKSLDNIALFFERVLLQIRDDQQLSPKFKLFTRQLKVSHIFSRDLLNIAESMNTPFSADIISLKTDVITIEKMLQLNRKINGLSYVFLRVDFVPYFKKKDVADYSDKTIAKIPFHQINYKPEVVAGISKSSTDFSSDDCVYFDDKDLSDFSIFYKEAVKYWKRSLKI